MKHENHWHEVIMWMNTTSGTIVKLITVILKVDFKPWALISQVHTIFKSRILDLYVEASMESVSASGGNEYTS